MVECLSHIHKVLSSTPTPQNKISISLNSSYIFAFKVCSLWDGDIVQLVECLPSKHEVPVQCHLNPMQSCMPVIEALKEMELGESEVQSHPWLYKKFKAVSCPKK